MPGSSEWCLHFRSSNQNFVCISHLYPMRATCPIHLIFHDLITSITFGEGYKL